MRARQFKICIILFLIITLFCFPPFFVSLAYSDDEDKWTGKDKALHLTVSFALDIFAYNYYKKNTNYSDSQAKRAAVLTSLGFGFAKEFIDDRFSWKDIGADLVGTAIGAAVSFEF